MTKPGKYLFVGPGQEEPPGAGRDGYTVVNMPTMHGHQTGKGQVYMAAYRDKDGDWLDGGVDYHDVSTRCIIANETGHADRSSRMDLLENDDGSGTLYIGPERPDGDRARNWIQTMPGKAWFPYFRLYSPKQAFLDKTWILPDIEKAPLEKYGMKRAAQADRRSA